MIVGAVDTEHVFTSYMDVPEAGQVLRWIDTVIADHLHRVPAIEVRDVRAVSGERLAIINVPASPVLITHVVGASSYRYEFPDPRWRLQALHAVAGGGSEDAEPGAVDEAAPRADWQGRYGPLGCRDERRPRWILRHVSL